MDDRATDAGSRGDGDSLIEPASVPCRRTVECFASDGESLVYYAALDQASALNRTATEIWELCDGTRNIAAIARELGHRYGVDPDDLLADVTTAVSTFRERGLVDLSSAPGHIT